MAGKRKEAEKLITVQAAVPVVIWRATRPLSQEQHQALAKKIELEQERSGLKVMLVPYSVSPELDVEVIVQQENRNSAAVEEKAVVKEEDQSVPVGGNNE